MAKKINALIIVRGVKSSYRRALEGHHFFFANDINILKKVNELLPAAITEYDKLTKLTHLETIKDLRGEDKKAYRKFLEAYKNLISNKQKKITVKSRTVAGIIRKSLEGGVHVNRINMFIREMSLVYLIIEFEQFLSRSLQVVFSKKSEIMKSRQKQITYEDLFNFDNFNDLKREIIEREADIIVNYDIENIEKYLQDRIGIDLSGKKSWKEFSERFYRRNILVHNNSQPNLQYRNKTGYKGASKRLDVTTYYLRRSFNLFSEYALLIKNNLVEKYAKL